MRRWYRGIAAGELADRGRWEIPLGRTRDRGGRHRASIGGTDAKDAITDFVVLARSADASLVELEPVTGRMHQLRAHLAHAAAPLFGDRLYGGPSQWTTADGRVTAIDRIALHAQRVELPTFAGEAPFPQELTDLWSQLAATPAPK